MQLGERGHCLHQRALSHDGLLLGGVALRDVGCGVLSLVAPRALGERLGVGVQHRHRPAVVQQAFDNGKADAGRSAGDDGHRFHLTRSRIDT